MKNVTITLDELTLEEARVAAAKEGLSLSKFAAEAIRARMGQTLSKKDAIDRFLDGPSLYLLNSDLTAPTTDQLYE